MNVTLVCENNIEGIMTAIYDGWVYMNKGYSVNIHPGSDEGIQNMNDQVPAVLG